MRRPSERQSRIISRELLRILKEYRRLTPQAVVREAAAKRSPLHKFFTWDDSKAARLYRLQQAQNLILSVRVTIEAGIPNAEHRAFVRVVDSDGSRYVPSYEACSEYRDQVLARALHEIEVWKCRYRDLRELSEIVKAVDGVLMLKAAMIGEAAE